MMLKGLGNTWNGIVKNASILDANYHREFPSRYRHLLGLSEGEPFVWNQFPQHAGTSAISVITTGELLSWARRAKKPVSANVAVEQFLTNIIQLPVDVPIAELFGTIRGQLLDAGTPVGEMDLLIAATAIYHDLTLVTHNTVDYANIPNLRLNDWLQS